MSDFKIIETQEELDAVIKARLSREREKYADYEDLKKQLADFEAKETTYVLPACAGVILWLD